MTTSSSISVNAGRTEKPSTFCLLPRQPSTLAAPAGEHWFLVAFIYFTLSRILAATRLASISNLPINGMTRANKKKAPAFVAATANDVSQPPPT
jgi:hypothetical protein